MLPRLVIVTLLTLGGLRPLTPALSSTPNMGEGGPKRAAQAARGGVWTVAPAMPAPATEHVGVLLHDGRVLIAGGEDEVYGWPVPWAQLYDPVARSWSLAAPMHVGRIADTATVLTDGRVLVVGGLGPKLKELSSAEIFDPVRNTWTLTAPLPRSRFSQSSTLLPDGRILVVGGIVAGRISRTTLLYDPLKERWEPGPPSHLLHAQQSSVTLADGRVLIAGGFGGGPEVYDPRSVSWSVVGYTPLRTHPIMTALPDGTVLLATGVSPQERDLRSARVFDPGRGTWTATGSLQVRRDAATGTLLPNGRVLVAGGEQVSQHVLSSAELYDPTSREWSPAATMHAPRDAATATLLADGAVLVCGGMNLDEGVLDSCELYRA